MSEMRRQFAELLADMGFVIKPARGFARALDRDLVAWNRHANDVEVLRAVMCAGLFPNIVSVKNGKRRAKMLTLEDGKVEVHPGSVNAEESFYPHPWLVYGARSAPWILLPKPWILTYHPHPCRTPPPSPPSVFC
jgi:ATP-dependent RNA helicase DHX36